MQDSSTHCTARQQLRDAEKVFQKITVNQNHIWSEFKAKQLERDLQNKNIKTFKNFKKLENRWKPKNKNVYNKIKTTKENAKLFTYVA